MDGVSVFKSTNMRYGELLKQAALVVASSALFVLIVLATLTTTWAQRLSDSQEPLSWWAKTDVGTTLIVVRVFQGVLTAASTIAISGSFTRLHWNRINHEKGLPLADLLALSPTTDFMGTAQLIFSGTSKPGTRVGALARLCLTVFPGLAGILLFGVCPLTWLPWLPFTFSRDWGPYAKSEQR